MDSVLFFAKRRNISIYNIITRYINDTSSIGAGKLNKVIQKNKNVFLD